MPGYVTSMGDCGSCHKAFMFNPIRVPSFRFNGKDKEPICESCIIIINEKREERGLELWPIANDAYEGCREEEL